MEQTKGKLTVFYDGACVVCQREMMRYRQRDKDALLLLVDIAAPTFDPSIYDRTLNDFMSQLHVLDESGAFYTGVDAFTRIWQRLPQPELHLLAAVIALPGINLLARGGYGIFARLRRFLPNVGESCDDSSCNHIHRQ